MYRVIVNSNGKRRILSGYLWVFSNELHHDKSIPPGEIVDVYDSNSNFLAIAFYNYQSLISLKILSFNKIFELDSYIKKRIIEAYKYRLQFFDKNESFRLVYSEGDFLPGLIIDKFNNTFLIQVNSIGIYKILDIVKNVLIKQFNPDSIFLKIHKNINQNESLSSEFKLLYGKDNSKLVILENGIKYNVDLAIGQKTGFFFDQRENRRLLNRLSLQNKIGIDAFSYIGAWGLNALKNGAQNVIFIDSSKDACNFIEENIKINNFSLSNTEIINEEVVKVLKKFKDSGEKFDFIILDPPALIKRKRDISQGQKGYYNLNKLALDVLKDNGYLITCSCSYHLSEAKFREIVFTISRKKKIKLYHLFHGIQSYDHPFYILHPETKYLKCDFYIKRG